MKNVSKKKSIVIKLYRIYHWLWIHHFRFLSKMIYIITRIVFNCNIPPTVMMGDNVSIGHATGITIHQNAQIGNNVIIYQNVTIGRRNGKTTDAPIIGNNCIIGVGACVLGKIIIGNNVKIGANCVVIDNIDDNCTVVMQKNRVINNNNI